MLENNVVSLGAPGQRFWLAGLGDQLAYPLGHGRFRGVDDLPGTLAQVTNDDPVLLWRTSRTSSPTFRRGSR